MVSPYGLKRSLNVKLFYRENTVKKYVINVTLAFVMYIYASDIKHFVMTYVLLTFIDMIGNVKDLMSTYLFCGPVCGRM